jgi:hypothetical protein
MGVATSAATQATTEREIPSTLFISSSKCLKSIISKIALNNRLLATGESGSS